MNTGLLRKIALDTGVVSTLIPAMSALTNKVIGLTLPYPYDKYYMVDNPHVRSFDLTAFWGNGGDFLDSHLSIVAGGLAGWADGVGTSARFKKPNSCSSSPDGSTIFIADYANHAVRTIEVATSNVTTLYKQPFNDLCPPDSFPGCYDGAQKFNMMAVTVDGTQLLTVGGDNKIHSIQL